MKGFLIAIVFCGIASSGLAQDSLNVRQVGLISKYWYAPQKLEVVDTLAYLTTKYSGLRIVNIANSSQPAEIGNADLPGGPCDVGVRGNYAYVTASEYLGIPYGLRILDVSDPTSPADVGYLAMQGIAQEIEIRGDLAYVASRNEGVWILDLTNPSSPAEAGFYGMAEQGLAVSESGEIVYAFSQTDLNILDVSDPASPILLESLNFPDEIFCSGTTAGNYVYVTTNNLYEMWSRLRVIDVANPAAPSPAAVIDIDYIFPTTDIEIEGNRAYIVSDYTEEFGALRVVELTDPTNPSLITGLSQAVPAHGLTLGNDHLYLSDRSRAFRVYETTDPDTLREVGNCGEIRSLRTSAVSGNIACSSNYNELVLIDIQIPQQPHVAGSLDLRSNIYRITIEGDYAFVANWYAGLCIVDISNPALPVEVGNADVGVYRDIELSGSFAYLSGGNVGGATLDIIDITDPTNPILRGSCATPENAMGIAVEGNYAYVADREYGVRVIDVSDPDVPFEVAVYDSFGFARDVAISDNILCLSSSRSMRTIDITNPMSPIELGFWAYPGNSGHIEVVDNYVYFLSDLNDSSVTRLNVVDITDPANPIEAGYYNTPGIASQVSVDGNRAYAATWGYFGIYDCSEALGGTEQIPNVMPQTVALYPCYPNPFNPATAIRFDLPVSGGVKLTVSNLMGQTVQTLVDERMPAGAHAVSFDGTGFSSGVYFCTLKAGDIVSTQKMVLVK